MLADLPARSSGVLVEGPPGIGKSHLWRAGVAAAREAGFLVLAAQPAEAEARLGGTGLVDLFQTVTDDQLAELPAPQREALSAALLRTHPGGSPPEPNALAVACSNLVTRLAGPQPVILAVDDLQWLDDMTATILGFLARRCPPNGVGLLLAQRDLDEQRLASPAAELAAADLLVRHRIPPLGAREIFDLVPRRLGQHVPTPILKRVAEASGGNPFYALELARFWLADGGSGVDSGLPPSLSVLVSDRLATLPEKARTAAAAAAAQVKPTLTTLRAIDLAGAIGPVEQAGIVAIHQGVITFTHPLLAAAAYQSVSSPQRADLHRWLAEVIDDPEQSARHRALTGDGPSAETAALLDTARDRARGRADANAAIELARLAVSLTTADDPAREQRMLELGVLISQLGHVSEARAALEPLTGRDVSPAVRARALATLATLAFYGVAYDEAATWATQALRAAEETGDPDLVIEAHLALATVNEDTDTRARRLHAEQALTLAVARSPSIDQRQLVRAYAGALEARMESGEPFDDELYQRAVDVSPNLADLYDLTFDRAVWMYMTGDLETAWEIWTGLRQRALERGDPVAISSKIAYHAALTALARGDLRTAQALVEDHLRLAQGSGQQTNLNWACYGSLLVAQARGEFALAREKAAMLLANTDDSNLRANVLVVLGRLELLNGRPREAASALTEAIEITQRTGRAGVQVIVRAATAIAEAGEPQRAAEALALQHWLRDLPANGLFMLAGARAVIAAASGDEATALAEFDKALSQFAGDHWYPLERAQLLTLKGRALRRFRHRAAAKESLLEARAVYERCGAHGWIDQVDAEIGRIGLRRAGTDLTETERRVAELAATGMTSKQIAEALFMSVRSVETNLTRIYRKLDITSRAELGVRLTPGRG